MDYTAYDVFWLSGIAKSITALLLIVLALTLYLGLRKVNRLEDALLNMIRETRSEGLARPDHG